MGGGGQSAGSSSYSTETKLSKEQAKILQKREEQYQEYFFPELIDALEETKGDTIKTSMMANQAKSINTQHQQAKQSFAQMIAQRGLDGSGVESQGMLALERGKSSALSDAYYNSETANRSQRMQVLQMGGSMSPTPTTAAPMGQSGSSSSQGFNFFIK